MSFSPAVMHPQHALHFMLEAMAAGLERGLQQGWSREAPRLCSTGAARTLLQSRSCDDYVTLNLSM